MSNAFLTINPQSLLFIRARDAHQIIEAAGTEDPDEIIRLLNVGREAEQQRAATRSPRLSLRA